MMNFYRSLSSSEQQSARVLGRYALLMFTVPVAIAMALPVFIGMFGLSKSSSTIITATSATVSVLCIATTFAYLAYKEDERNSGESQARYIMSKPIKGD